MIKILIHELQSAALGTEKRQNNLLAMKMQKCKYLKVMPNGAESNYNNNEV